MVKNTKGGKGAKSMARKSAGSTSGMAFPIPTSDMEQFAVVNKMYGPNCEVLFIDGTKMLCHIRNKFKGRHKSANLISVGSILLVGFRDWESDNARKNCDLLFVYDSLQTSSLLERFSLPSLTSHDFSSQQLAFDYSFSTDTSPTPTNLLQPHFHNELDDNYNLDDNFDDL
jgi:hypothetical protein